MDDMHLAPDEVRRRFLSKERSWLDSPTYTATIKGKPVEMPTRYLVPIITMNLTDNQERIDKFRVKGQEPTLAIKILATLSAANGSGDIDHSFLRRQGRVVNLNEFPAEAKAPQLAVQSRKVSQTILENDSKFVVASDASIQLMSNRFSRADARSFLSAATTALTVPARSAAGGAFIVIPRSERATEGVTSEPSHFVASGTEITSQIEAFGEQRMQFVTLDGPRSFRGRAALTHFVAENFRRNLFRMLLRALYEDPRFARGRDNQQFWGAPFMQAVHDHLSQNRSVDIEALGIEPRELGYSSVDEAAQFRRAVHAYSLEQQIVGTELPFLSASRASSTLDQFLGRGTGSNQRTRADVMRQTGDDIVILIERLLATNLKVSELRQLPTNHRTWLSQIDGLPINLQQAGGADMVSIVVRFLTQIDSRGIDAMGGGPLTNYEAMRLFFMVLDQSLARLPWGRVSEHFSGVIRTVTSNAAVAQLQPVQQYIFDDRSSLMVSQDMATMLLLAEGFPNFKDGDGDARRTSFSDRCKAWLEPQRSGGST
jgi:hypothetical protein